MATTQVQSTDVFAAADTLAALKERKEAVSEELKAINAEIETTNAELSAAMVENELQNFVRGDRQFYLKSETYASCNAANKPRLFEWLQAHGAGDLIKQDVHARTLSAYIKELLEENDDELPDELEGVVGVFEKLTVGLRKAK